MWLVRVCVCVCVSVCVVVCAGGKTGAASVCIRCRLSLYVSWHKYDTNSFMWLVRVCVCVWLCVLGGRQGLLRSASGAGCLFMFHDTVHDTIMTPVDCVASTCGGGEVLSLHQVLVVSVFFAHTGIGALMLSPFVITLFRPLCPHPFEDPYVNPCV